MTFGPKTEQFRSEKELINLKSNLNAIYGAVQQVDKLIVMSKEGNKSKSRQEADKASEVA